MITDDDDDRGECEGQLCDWCHEREAEGDHMVFGLGRLCLCERCAMMLLSSIIDSE